MIVEMTLSFLVHRFRSEDLGSKAADHRGWLHPGDSVASCGGNWAAHRLRKAFYQQCQSIPTAALLLVDSACLQPDLPLRLLKDIPLAKWHQVDFYAPEEPRGYTDYPFARESVSQGKL